MYGGWMDVLQMNLLLWGGMSRGHRVYMELIETGWMQPLGTGEAAFRSVLSERREAAIVYIQNTTYSGYSGA